MENFNTMKPPYPSEHEEQAAYVRWLELQAVLRKYPDLLIGYANINEQKFAPGETRIGRIKRLKKLKAQDHKAGVPDFTLPIPRYPYHGLYIEFKSRNPKAMTSDDQKHYIKSLTRLGYLTEVCWGSDQAIIVTETYLKLPSWEQYFEDL